MEHRVCVIGAGDVVRRVYLPSLAMRADCKIKGISSQRGRSAEELAARYGIEAVLMGHEEILGQDDVDTVFICTPPHLHKEIAEAAMERNKNILVEKPLCANYRDSRSLLRRARAYPKTFYAAFNNYFREENQWLKSKVMNGEVGNVEVIDIEWLRTRRYENKAWLYDPGLSGGGVLMDLGSHMIHFALSLIPQRIRFAALCHNMTHEWQSAVESTSTAMVTVDNKVTILLKLGWDMKLPVQSSVVFTVYGSEGSLSNQEYQGSKTDGYGRMIDDLFCCMDSATRPNLGLVEDTMLLLDALYESAGSQSFVRGEFCVVR